MLLMIPALQAEESLSMLHVLQMGSGNMAKGDFNAAVQRLRSAAGARVPSAPFSAGQAAAMGIEVERVDGD